MPDLMSYLLVENAFHQRRHGFSSQEVGPSNNAAEHGNHNEADGRSPMKVPLAEPESLTNQVPPEGQWQQVTFTRVVCLGKLP